MRHAVIMAGGNGTRLWPVSRQATPKQFQKLIGDKTLIQQTYERLVKSFDSAAIWVVAGAQHGDLIRRQLPNIPTENIILEPIGRNTAAATVLAALTIVKTDPQATIFGLVPADHYIGKPAIFRKTAESLMGFLENNPEFVATIGIHPSEANTGLGYIKMGEKLAESGGKNIHRVESFHEKPDQRTAEQFVEDAQYLWNGGYYLFSGAGIIRHFERLAPAIIKGVRDYLLNPSLESYQAIPSQSIDKAIAEKLSQMAVIPAEMGWSDIGNWAALHEILTKSGQQPQAAAEYHVSDGSENTFVLGGSKLVATVGLKDVVVIDTDDVILVCARNSVQDVKKVVEQLQEQGRSHLI